MNELKSTIAKNLVELRQQAHLTQLQLAEMLNYSDKAVSKWERGEAIPDLRVLTRLAEIYGVSLDDIVKGESVAPQVQPKKRIVGTHAFITALSAVLVWFIATGVFLVFFFVPQTAEYAYLVYVSALLPTAIVLTVFAIKWGKRVYQAIATSLIPWSCAAIMHAYVWQFAREFQKIYFIYIVAAVFEILIILWFTYRWYLNKKGNK